MTTSLAFHQPTHLLAPQIPHGRYLADILMRNNGFIPD
jgi:hypothetical protein